MSEHTPEPWERIGTVIWVPVQIDDAGNCDQMPIAECGNIEDARRIIACVNACNGMETELLECLSIPHELTMANKKNSLLTKQKNAAEEALCQAKERAERGHHGDLIACDITIALANIETMS